MPQQKRKEQETTPLQPPIANDLEEWELIIINDLEKQVLTTNSRDLPARRAWDEVYKHLVEFVEVEYNEFRDALKFYRARQKEKLPMVDWQRSAARQVIIDDLKSGVLSPDEEVMSAQEAWDTVYSFLVEFHGVPFQQFKEKLKEHRETWKQRNECAAWDKMAVDHYRNKFRVKTHNHRGEPRFCLDKEAKKKLLKDVKNGRHKRYKPSELRLKRPEYKQYTLTVFRQCIHQTVRRIKFENYLEKKQEEKEKLRRIHLASRNPARDVKRRKKQN
jgi:hypothetical protein